jgi:hypothetical protein
VDLTTAAQREKRFSEAPKKLRAVHEILADLEKQYPEFWVFLRDVLRNDLDPANQIPEGMDLETWAKQQGALPLEAFIDDLFPPAIDFAVDLPRQFVLVRDCQPHDSSNP